MMPPVYAALMADPTVAAMTGGRIRQDVGNPDEGAPYIVWGLLSATPELTTKRRAPADRCSISVDVFARDEAERATLTKAAREALEPHGHILTIQSLGQDEETRLWRMTFDMDWFITR